MFRFNLALRLLWRDSRSGELTILVLALLIAVTSSSAIALFANRLQRTMALQTAEFLAADVLINSPTQISDAWTAKAAELNLTSAKTVEFASVLLEHEEMLLSSVKAVSDRYPLRGVLKIQDREDAAETVTQHAPDVGTAWVDRRVLSALHLQLGEALTVGEKALTVTRILTYEPDKQGDFYSFSPRVLMNGADLAATNSIQAGSHVHYGFGFVGSAEALADFTRWLKPQLNPSQKLLNTQEDKPELGAALNRAERYLGLTSIMVVLISGVAIAMATRRYSERHFNATAILRCLGCKQNDILWLYSSQFVMLGVCASAVGCLLGWFAQEGLFVLLRDLLPRQLAAPSFAAVLFGFGLGMAVLLGFALPPLLRLKRVSPLRVLRRELEPLPTSAWLIYGLSLTVVSALIWHYTGELKMTALVIGVGLAVLLLLAALLAGLLKSLRYSLVFLPLAARFALQGLLRDSKTSGSQILAFSITLLAMLLSFTVRSDLIADWQTQLPANAPNHFALNIFAEQREAMQQDLQQAQITSNRFYPVVRGRLVRINDVPVQRIVSKDSQGEGATQRELSLTWTQDLPEDNQLVAGQWWQDQQAGLVSVEEKLADSLKIKLGDTLTFTIGSSQLQAKVASFRALRWDTMKPNFYMVFSPRSLDAYPSTYLTSFYLPPQKKAFLNTLVKKYASVTVLEVDAVLQKINTIITQLTQAINYLLVFALMAGFTVLFAAVYASLDNRRYEGALMRTLGARRQFLRSTQLIEFTALGALSGLFATLLAEAICYALYTRLLHLHYALHGLWWLVMPLLGAVLVALAGCWALRKVVNESPLRVLRAG